MTKATAQDVDLEGLLKTITRRCNGSYRHDVAVVGEAIEPAVEDQTFYDEKHWPDFVKFLQGNGFRQVHSYQFKNPWKSKDETFAVWVHDDLGIFASTETYYGSLNSINIYYELPLPKAKTGLSAVKQAVENYLLGQCSFSWARDAEPKTLLVKRDGRDKLASHLVALRLYGRLMGAQPTNTPWKHFGEHFFYLCDYSETPALSSSDTRSSDARISEIHRESTARNLAALPEDVQKMIGYAKPANQ